MIGPLLKFARLCRAAGIRISTSELLDCTGQLEVLDICDEEQFRFALAANLVKDREDRARFDEIYDLFFHRVPDWLEKHRHHALSAHLLDAADPSGTDVPEGLFPGRFIDPLSGDPAAFIEELMGILSLEPDEPEIPFSRLPPPEKGGFPNDRAGSAEGAPGLLERDGISEGEGMRGLGDLLTERLGIAVQKFFSGGAETGKRVPEKRKPGRPGADIAGIAFSSLTEEEAREVHRAIDRLARKLKDQVTRRYARKKRGITDILKTIRRSARYDGIPMEIRLRKKPPRKTKIVALCDVSYSVWTAVPFMLNVLYSLQDCFRQVRSFVFISSVVEVSEAMEHKDVARAVDGIMEEFRLRPPKNAVYGDEKDRDPGDAEPEISDYRSAFDGFRRNFADALDRNTTLIILGDGRNNFFETGEDHLAALKERCRRILWLNPEPESLWNTGDSRIGVYRPHCRELRSCGNLGELSDFVAEFVLQ